MAVVHVEKTLPGLIRDMRLIPRTMKVRGRAVVRRNAEIGNHIAKTSASKQHTMHSSIDVPYHESFSVEQRGPMDYEYGPVDDGIYHGGSQATGYEFGSRNQPPHGDLAKSRDRIAPRLYREVGRMVDGLFWPGAG